MAQPPDGNVSPTFAWQGGTLDAEEGEQGPSTPAGDAAAPLIAQRYRDQGPLRVGGMGEVRRVWDLRLWRPTAMKIIRPEKATVDRAVERFVREAHTTGRLQHPGIVPVHDMGQLEDGRWWFTMKEVIGRTFEDALAELHALTTPESWPTRPGGPSFRRMVDALLRTCQTMAYAHAQGFVHRDLKPENLMLGRFGEVLVVDWGLGKLVETLADEETHSGDEGWDQVEALLRASSTVDGGVVGSPPYMAPEQARGETERLGAPMDVYALGAVLYQLMAGVPPYRGSSPRDIVEQVRAGPPVPVMRAARHRCPEPDAELVGICERAMARDPGLRYGHAGELARALEDWLDGTRRMDEARAIVAGADGALRQIEQQRGYVAGLRAEAAALLAAAEGDPREESHRPGWEREERAEGMELEIGMAEAEYEVTLQSALKLAPSLPDAHERLADLYRRRLEQAEGARDGLGVTRYETMLRAHDRGRHAAWLRADGRLSMATQPAGASVTVHRVIQRHRRFVMGEGLPLGHTPLDAVEVPRGSLVVEVALEGHPVVRLPLHIRRGEHVDHVPPGGPRPVVLSLPTLAELGHAQVFVPAGWAIVGGDPLALDPLPRRRVWIDGFVITRTHVTVREYASWLEDLVAHGRQDEADGHVPRSVGSGGHGPLWTCDEEGRYREVEGGVLVAAGEALPVTRITWADAMAYADWRAARDGLPWRLPHDLEWEKAARGVDGRAYPWGDAFVPGRANVSDDSDRTPSVCPAGSFPDDRSVYGMVDASGNVRSWCGNAYRKDSEVVDGARLVVEPAAWAGPAHLRMVRGGSFASQPHLARLASRFASAETLTYAAVGLRLVRPVGG